MHRRSSARAPAHQTEDVVEPLFSTLFDKLRSSIQNGEQLNQKQVVNHHLTETVHDGKVYVQKSQLP
jgi:hypothetical protein